MSYSIWGDLYKENWFPPLTSYVNLRYNSIENRMINTFDYITPENKNKRTYSFVYSSIIRDVGSVFDSALRLINNNTGKKFKDNIEGFICLFETYDKNLSQKTVTMNYNGKTIRPFIKDEKGHFKWWKCYNHIKHDESKYYLEGNLENSLTSLAGLAILRESINPWSKYNIIGVTGLFTHIAYNNNDDSFQVSKEMSLFFDE